MVKSNLKKRKARSKKQTIKFKKQLGKLVYIFLIIIVLVAVSAISFAFLSNDRVGKKDEVLSASANSSNYSVNEDDLAMFATLAYETPSPLKPVSSGRFDFKVHDYDRLSERVKCTANNVALFYGSNRATCLKSNKSSSTRYMYQAEDIVGNNYEPSIIKRINEYGTLDVLAHIGQWIMATAIGKEEGESFYFSDMANLATADSNLGNLKDWEIVDFKEDTSFSSLDNYGLMSAVTFKRGNDIVIAYRGTDLTDLADWVGVDGSYATKNNSQQDASAITYAQDIAKIYNGDGQNQYKIYLTGHSLGGYLAQVAGAGLLGPTSGSYAGALNADNTISNPYNLQRIVYFNGMSLFFSQKSLTNIANSQLEASNKLKSFNMNPDGSVGDKILLVRMHGDVVSAIGVHHGRVKTIFPSGDIIKKHNNGLISAYSLLVDVLGEVGAKKITSSSRWTDFMSSSRSNLIEFLTRLTKNWTNLTLVEIEQEVDRQYQAGQPFKGILPYFMSTHETDSFFYSQYYYNMNNNNYGPSGNTARPVRESITSTPFDLNPVVSSISYSGPYCTFWSDYLPIDKQKINNRNYDMIYLTKNDTITGRISCFSANGFSKNTINLKDIIYGDDSILYTIANVKLNGVTGDTAGLQLVPGDNRLLYWNVKITPTSRLITGKLNTGHVHSLALKAGVLKDGMNNMNSIALFPYRIQIKDNTASRMSRKGEPLPGSLVVPTNGDVTSDTLSCRIVLPNIIKTYWLFNKTYKGMINCVSSTLLSDFSISSSDLVAIPSNRVNNLSVSYVSRSSVGDRYNYTWEVRFKGYRRSPGKFYLNLRAGSVKTLSGKNNNSTISNQSEVTR